MKCLVIGATGYVGARLVPRLLDAGHDVRVLARDARKVAARPWGADVDTHVGDVADPRATAAACTGMDAVFYLVHMMDATGKEEFRRRDLEAAESLAEAAADAGVGRIVYLGGLQPDGATNSAHLASRHEVGEVFLASGVPSAVMQAGIVVGTGSASYEMLRHLASSSPVLPMPTDAFHRIQPIAIDDVLYHLMACLDLPPEVNTAFDVGGADVLTYRDMLVGYAEAAGLPARARAGTGVGAAGCRCAGRRVGHARGPLPGRTAAGVDGLRPGVPRRAADRCAARWTGHLSRGRPAVAGRRGRRGGDAVRPAGCRARQRADRARRRTRRGAVAGDQRDRWRERLVHGSGSLGAAREDRHPVRRVRARAAPGPRRWRRARRWTGGASRPSSTGGCCDCAPRRRCPGVARLEMRAEPDGTGSRYVQRSTFEPLGLPGRVYWYAQLPAHAFVFAVMARTIAGVAAKGITRPA